MVCPTEGSGNQSKKTSCGKSRKKKDLEEDLPDQRLQVQTASETIEPLATHKDLTPQERD